MHSFSSPKHILTELSRSHGFDVRFGEYHLQQQWQTIAGASVAPHTWPTRIKFRTLHVAVENSVWLHQLTYLKASLLKNVQAAFDQGEVEVQDIIFRLGDIPPPTEHPARETAPGIAEDAATPRVSTEAWKIAADCAHVVQDTALRESLTRVIALALSSGPRTTNP